jgi:hypothetical protein
MSANGTSWTKRADSSVPIAAICLPTIGEIMTVADHVCFLRYRVKCRSSQRFRWRHRPQCRSNGAFDLGENTNGTQLIGCCLADGDDAILATLADDDFKKLFEDPSNSAQQNGNHVLTRYSALTQICTSNVKDLAVA